MKNFFSITFLTLITALMPKSVFAQNNAIENARKRLQNAAGSSGIGTGAEPGEIVGSIINAAVSILGVIAVILIVYAGGMWLTAAGNDEKVNTAKKIIRTTVIGILIVGLAYGITTFIISTVISA